MLQCILSCFSRVRLFATPWTVACQAPLSMGFPRQEYWSGLPYPPPRDLSDTGTKPSLMSPALAGRFFMTSTTCKALYIDMCVCVCVCVCVCIACYCSVTKSCLTLCSCMDCSMPGSSLFHYLPDCSNSCLMSL